MGRVRRFRSRVLWTAAICIASAVAARGAEIHWVGYQADCLEDNPPVEASYFHGDNWLGYAVPGPGNTAHFGATVEQQGNPNHIHLGDFHLDEILCPSPFALPAGVAGPDGIVVRSGQWVIDAEAQSPGGASGSLATGILDVGTTLDNGFPGNALLRLRGDSLSVTHLFLAPVGGASGTVLVDDSSQLEIDVELGVGRLGSGTMVISDGSQVSAGFFDVGTIGGSVGDLTVTGVGSRLDTTGFAWIGDRSEGSLQVENGAMVGAASLVVGRESALGGLEVSSSGEVQVSGDAVFGSSSGARGEVRVRGPGSQLIVSGWLTCSASDEAESYVEVSNGAHLEQQSGRAYLGHHGAFDMEIVSGGSVRTNDARLGNPNEPGTAVITGLGSSWIADNGLLVGDYGTGSVTLEQGGLLDVATGWCQLGVTTDAHGVVSVQDAGSELRVPHVLKVGNDAGDSEGTLVLGAGGMVTGGTVDFAPGGEVVFEITDGPMGPETGAITTGSINLDGILRVRVASSTVPSGTTLVAMSAGSLDGSFSQVVWEGAQGSVQVVGNELHILLQQVTAAPGRPATEKIMLEPNRPNPFNPHTTLGFSVPHRTHVRLAISSLDGRLVSTLLDRELEAGRHEVSWDGRDGSGSRVASGSYLCRVGTPRTGASRILSLVK